MKSSGQQHISYENMEGVDTGEGAFITGKDFRHPKDVFDFGAGAIGLDSYFSCQINKWKDCPTVFHV